MFSFGRPAVQTLISFPATISIQTEYRHMTSHKSNSTTSMSETSLNLSTHRSYQEHFCMQVNRQKKRYMYIDIHMCVLNEGCDTTLEYLRYLPTARLSCNPQPAGFSSDHPLASEVIKLKWNFFAAETRVMIIIRNGWLWEVVGHCHVICSLLRVHV